MTKKSGSINEFDHAMLRATFAFADTALAISTNENVRGLLGAEKLCVTCPLYGNAASGTKRCQEYRCDECPYRFAKST
jgi:hypothetical protein